METETQTALLWLLIATYFLVVNLKSGDSTLLRLVSLVGMFASLGFAIAATVQV